MIPVIALFLSIASQFGDIGESWVKRIFGVKDSGKIIPGHGPLATRADLEAYGEGLRTMRGLVAELVAEGHPIDHILEFRPIQPQAEAWGVTDRAEEDAFVETIYRGVTAP